MQYRQEWNDMRLREIKRLDGLGMKECPGDFTQKSWDQWENTMGKPWENHWKMGVYHVLPSGNE